MIRCGQCIRCESFHFDLTVPCSACQFPAQACRPHGRMLFVPKWAGTWWKPWTWLHMTYSYIACPSCLRGKA